LSGFFAFKEDLCISLSFALGAGQIWGKSLVKDSMRTFPMSPILSAPHAKRVLKQIFEKIQPTHLKTRKKTNMERRLQMKSKTTLENVINTVHKNSQDNYDEIIPVRDLSFDSLERMDIAGKSFSVLPSAQRLLANRLRVPFSYLMNRPGFSGDQVN
jgi:hypothetical protein